MGVDQHHFFKWWSLVSFHHEIVLLENADPDEGEDGAKAIIFVKRAQILYLFRANAVTWAAAHSIFWKTT